MGSSKKTSPPGEMGQEALSTLNKYLADAGVCSRRKAVELIASGKVTVDGHTIEDAGRRIEAGQVVKVGNKVVKPTRKLYIMLNKPANCVSTLSDPEGRTTILDLVKLPTKDRIYHVGRLDYATTGLLLLTNDGDLAERLSHPRYEVKKTYHVTLDRGLLPQDLMVLKQGIELRDGLVVADDAYYLGKRMRNPVCVALHSGKNRVVRRMFSALGYDVRKLDRVLYAGISKHGLSKGHWRYLTAREVASLTGSGRSARAERLSTTSSDRSENMEHRPPNADSPHVTAPETSGSTYTQQADRTPETSEGKTHERREGHHGEKHADRTFTRHKAELPEGDCSEQDGVQGVSVTQEGAPRPFAKRRFEDRGRSGAPFRARGTGEEKTQSGQKRRFSSGTSRDKRPWTPRSPYGDKPREGREGGSFDRSEGRPWERSERSDRTDHRPDRGGYRRSDEEHGDHKTPRDYSHRSAEGSGRPYTPRGAGRGYSSGRPFAGSRQEGEGKRYGDKRGRFGERSSSGKPPWASGPRHGDASRSPQGRGTFERGEGKPWERDNEHHRPARGRYGRPGEERRAYNGPREYERNREGGAFDEQGDQRGERRYSRSPFTGSHRQGEGRGYRTDRPAFSDDRSRDQRPGQRFENRFEQRTEKRPWTPRPPYGKRNDDAQSGTFERGENNDRQAGYTERTPARGRYTRTDNSHRDRDTQRGRPFTRSGSKKSAVRRSDKAKGGGVKPGHSKRSSES